MSLYGSEIVELYSTNYFGSEMYEIYRKNNAMVL